MNRLYHVSGLVRNLIVLGVLGVVGIGVTPACRSTHPAQELTAVQTTTVTVPLAAITEAVDTDADPNVVAVSLTAAPFTFPNPLSGKNSVGYAYNGQIPGPTIRAKVGNTVRVTLNNELADPTTIHWHGVNVPITMDGVPWKAPAVGPGESFVYEFVVQQVGTFWYHPHFDTGKQMDWGLYGAFVVDGKNEPKVDDDRVLVMDTWGEFGLSPAFPPLGGAWGEERMGGGMDHDADHGIDTRRLQWTVNGLVQPELTVEAGSVVRLRMVNVSNNGYLELTWPSIRQVGGDQGVLAELLNPETLVLAPGDRAEVELLVGNTPIVVSTWPYTLHGGRAAGEPTEVFRVIPEGQGSVPTGASWGFSGDKPSVDPPFTDWVYVLTGSNDGGTWMINGEVFPDMTPRKTTVGSRPVVEIRNLSATEHPFHTHGMFFEVLSRNGVQPSTRTIEDTINVRIREAVRIELHPDGPGEWMVHCHILPHAHGGMMTILNVETSE